MRAITKGPEPPSLTAHRQTPPCSYDNYPDKDALRRALVTEQRGLCCYCMGRIRADRASMKIEHWRSQAHHETRQLDYQNILAACQGGLGQPPRLQHCDTKKGNSDLDWNPADPDHRIETRIKYEADGAVRSDGDFNDQLDQVLNLNLPVLKNSRKGVLEGVLYWWRSEKARIRGPVPRDRLVRERDKLIAENGVLDPYSPVAVWWLNQKLDKMVA